MRYAPYSFKSTILITLRLIVLESLVAVKLRHKSTSLPTKDTDKLSKILKTAVLTNTTQRQSIGIICVNHPNIML